MIHLQRHSGTSSRQNCTDLYEFYPFIMLQLQNVQFCFVFYVYILSIKKGMSYLSRLPLLWVRTRLLIDSGQPSISCFHVGKLQAAAHFPPWPPLQEKRGITWHLFRYGDCAESSKVGAAVFFSRTSFWLIGEVLSRRITLYNSIGRNRVYGQELS